MTEDQLQATCFQWAHNTYPQIRRLLWAVPNGGRRNIMEAQKLKATGVVAGVHDLHLFYRHKFYTFELKVGNNHQTEAQRIWGELIVLNGGHIYEIRSVEDFKTIINQILL